MDRKPRVGSKSLVLRLARRYAFALRLAGCFCAVIAATLSVGLEDVGGLIWVANGILLSYLLVAPRWRWIQYFAVGFAAEFLGGFVVNPGRWAPFLALTCLNIGEVAIGTILLRKRSTQLPRFTDQKYLLRFLAFAILGGPLAMGLIFALVDAVWMHGSPWRACFSWVTTDSLGTAIAAPACVSLFRSKLSVSIKWKSLWVYLVILVVVAYCSFCQSHWPVIFFIYPVIAIILFRFGLGWASVSALYVAGVGSWFTVHGIGPFIQNAAPGLLSATLQLQLYIASGMFMIFAASSVMEALRSTRYNLQKIVSLHQLVTDNSRDIIILADFDGKRSYVSPAGNALTGWNEELIKKQRSLDLIHPDDQAEVRALIKRLRSGGPGGLIECRVLKPAGDYMWVESNLHPIPDPVTGAPTGILNIVREIGERKAAEQARDMHLSLIAAIQEVSLDAVLVVNDEGKVISYNKRFSEVWKITAPTLPATLLEGNVDLSDELLLGQCVDQTKDPVSFLRRVLELYADHSANEQSQIELKDGRTLERYSTSLLGQNGKYLGRVWFFRDISERKRGEMELRAANSSLETLAVTDPLTGLANRRRFDQFLSGEWRRGARDRTPLSVLLMDVDWFKSYNDTYGHLSGDGCLKQIASAVLNVVTRSGDLAARIGGEEFAVILPNTPARGAMQVAEQICAALLSRRLPHSSNPFGYVTISVGCATMMPALGQRSASLLQRADEAMYAAKRSSRNRICEADSIDPDSASLQAS